MKVGIVGAGSIARGAHLPAFKSIPSMEVVNIADVDEKAAKRLSKEFGVPNSTRNYLDLMNDPSIELIDLCTPVQVRLDIIKKAAQMGKHILVEKPLAISLKEALEIYDEIQSNNVKLNVIHNYRYFPCVNQVKDRISRGYLGDIISIQSCGLTPHPAESTKATWLYHEGGALYDFTPHLIDLLLWINNSPVEKVVAFGGDFTGSMGHINHCQILIEFHNMSVAVADVSWLTSVLGMRFSLNIHGSGGNILMDVRNNHYIEYHDLLTPFDELGSAIKKAAKFVKYVADKSFFKGPTAFHRNIIVDFANSIERGHEPPVSVKSGVIVNAVLEAAKESLRTKQEIRISDLFDRYGYDYNVFIDKLCP